MSEGIFRPESLYVAAKRSSRCCDQLCDPHVVRADVSDSRWDEIQRAAANTHHRNVSSSKLAKHLLIIAVRDDPVPAPVLEGGHAVGQLIFQINPPVPSRMRVPGNAGDNFAVVILVQVQDQGDKPLGVGTRDNEDRHIREKSYSLLKLTHPDVFVWTVKPSEEGIERGMIVRVWNISQVAVQCELVCARPVTGAKQTTHIETDLDDVWLVNGKLPVALAPQ